MKRTTDKVPSLSEQIKKKVQKDIVKKEEKEYTDGDFGTVISTGSTLLDLAISSGRIRGGGVPSGIFVELFGPPDQEKLYCFVRWQQCTTSWAEVLCLRS